MSDRLLTAEELAARWQVSIGHVYQLTRTHSLGAVRLGRYYRYAIEAIEEFERAGGTDGRAPAEKRS